jgi:hypothetical protein
MTILMSISLLSIGVSFGFVIAGMLNAGHLRADK